MIARWLNKHSLNFKLNVSIICCVSLGFLALVYFISKRSEPIIISQINDLALKSVSSYAAELDHLIYDTEQIVNSTKNTLNQTEEDDINSLQMVLTSVIKTINYDDLDFTEAWVYNFNAEDVSKGTLYISEKNNDDEIVFYSKQIDNFYDSFPWFKAVPKEEKIYWSEPYIDDETGSIVVTCLIPFMYKGNSDFNGLAAMTVDLRDVRVNINEYSLYDKGKLLMISKSGLYVAHPDPNINLNMTIFELADKLKAPRLRVAGEEVLKGNVGYTTIDNSSVFNGSVMIYYAPIRQIGWGLYLVYAQNELLTPIHRFQFIMAMALIIAILLLFLIINRICSNSTKQIISLSRMAMRYGTGDFKDSFDEVPSSSDIGMLARAMSNMRSNLLKYTENERQEAAEKQKSRSELEIAGNIQKSSLSVKYPKNDSFDISTIMVPAKGVGGDFYDFFFIDENRFVIVIADVSGKGIPAALYMMKAQTLIKNISKGKLSPDMVFHHANNELYEGNDTCMFVTAFLAVIDLKTGEVNYVNAGHLPPLVGNQATGYEFIKPKKNVILGVKRNADFEAEKMTLKPGDHIFLYTDGVTEAENQKSKFYGDDRLKKVLQKPARYSAENLAKVMDGIKKFVRGNPQSDDITMLDFAYFGESRLTVVADNKNLHQVIDFLKKDMTNHNLDEKKQFRLVNAAEEIFANIADYAYGENSGTAEINTYVQNEVYYAEFADKGKKYNPLKNKEPDLSRDLKNRKIGGLGVYIAKRMADEISYTYKNGKNILTIGIRL